MRINQYQKPNKPMLNSKSMLKNSVIRIVLGTGLTLMIPYILQWPWTRSDFVVAGVVLFVTGLALYLIIRKGGKYRIPEAIVIVFLFLWLWVELAVGLFTNWGS
jgi:hypothetical protein